MLCVLVTVEGSTWPVSHRHSHITPGWSIVKRKWGIPINNIIFILYTDTQHRNAEDHFAYATGIIKLFFNGIFYSVSLFYCNGCGVIAPINITCSVAFKITIVCAAFMANKLISLQWNTDRTEHMRCHETVTWKKVIAEGTTWFGNTYGASIWEQKKLMEFMLIVKL
jgi:hypothetical protein